MSEPATTDDVPLQTFREKGSSASQFRFGSYYVLVSCNRVTDKKTIERFIKDYGIEKPASSHVIKALGFRISIDDEKAQLFRYSKKPIEVGREQWAFSIRRNSLQPVAVYGLSLQIFEADPVNRVDFTTQSAIDAALAVYRCSIEQAEFALRQELLRIASNASKEYREPTWRPETPTNPNIPKGKPEKQYKSVDAVVCKDTGKRLVVFKKR